jgi:type IV secretory pathway VirB2 component (pilin)
MSATLISPADMLQKRIDLVWAMIIVLAIVVVANLIPHAALASNAIEDALCNVVDLMTGRTGKAIATVAVIVVGIGALMGKISWGMAFIVAIGIALVFGAGTIVDAVSDNAGSDC